MGWPGGRVGAGMAMAARLYRADHGEGRPPAEPGRGTLLAGAGSLGSLAGRGRRPAAAGGLLLSTVCGRTGRQRWSVFWFRLQGTLSPRSTTDELARLATPDATEAPGGADSGDRGAVGPDAD